MATKKQAKQARKRNYSKLQAKVVERQERRQHRLQVLAWSGVVVGFVALIAIAALWVASLGDDALDLTSTPSPSPSPIATPTLPPPEAAQDRAWFADVDTSHGAVRARLDGVAAPQAVASFVTLAQEGFFDGTECHRLVTEGIFVLQCGDPTGTGTGGPGYRFGPIENAPTDDVYPAGTIALARVGNNPDSMGSQFFFVYEDSTIPPDAAGGYTVFGTVTEGLDVIQAIAEAGTETGTPDGPPAEPVILEEVDVT